jgi:DNA repair ATPase RecN
VKNRAEVKNMFLTDFDEKKYRKILARDAKEEGRTEGRVTGRAESREIINELTKRLIQDGRMEDLKRSLDDHAYQDQMLKEYGLEYTDKEME